jgi:hypothetical protein
VKNLYGIILFLVLIVSGFVVQASDDDLGGRVRYWSMSESEDGKGRLFTQPLTEEGFPFWYSLHGSSAVRGLFADGNSKEPSQVKWQAERSVVRLQNHDPRFVHVIFLEIDGLTIPIGTGVLGGSARGAEYCELTLLMHPAYCTSSEKYFDEEIDNELRKRGELGFNPEDYEDIIQIWGKGYALRLWNMAKEQFLPKFIQAKASYVYEEREQEFDGQSIQGIDATASNPFSLELLGKIGFEMSEEKRPSRFGVDKYDGLILMKDLLTNQNE